MSPLATHRENPSGQWRRRTGRRRLVFDALEGRALLTAVSTSLSVAVSNTALFYTQTEAISATVSVPSGVAAPNGGTITFFDNGNELGTAAVSSGTASYTPSSLPLGPNALTASYAGFLGSDGTQYGTSVATGPQSSVFAVGLSSVSGVAVDSAGDVFVADSAKNDVIEQVSAGNQIDRRIRAKRSKGRGGRRSGRSVHCRYE